jgi:hypothetical protein
MVYNEIYNFCKVRDLNRKQYSNRAKFLVELLTRLGIEHKIVRTKSLRYNKYFYNIYCFGNSDKFLSAHYDVVNINVDNANDDSASVINCIQYKLMNPSVNLLILDGEEPPFMGSGSTYAAKYLKANNIPVKWIFNLELTGVGKTFFIDNANTQLSTCIQSKFPEAIVTGTPFNDAMIFRQFGFQSNVVTTINLTEDGKPDMGVLYHSHGPMDSVDKMSIEDMKNFVEKVVDVVVKTC